eukprot:TRINITY_DN10641_c0_g1_i5.p1 TRINITY_DN10641_c0_g1~~TRINITY_DN10641_c0_g1_i5.p1  ORF type:complete len:101 (+),score=23.55 TRINITY_DN10641_c0_g1_i5:196-498(+)
MCALTKAEQPHRQAQLPMLLGRDRVQRSEVAEMQLPVLLGRERNMGLASSRDQERQPRSPELSSREAAELTRQGVLARFRQKNGRMPSQPQLQALQPCTL